MMKLNDLYTGFNNFQDVGKAVLSFLHQHLGFELWMITRVDNEDWIVLQSEDHGYDVHPGAVFRWSDSFCSHMVLGETPTIAPDSEKIPLYKTAPIAQQVKIRAYIGQPLWDQNGELFGTLCAIDPNIKDDSLFNAQAMIELLANLLSYVLQAELRESELKRQYERLEAEVLKDHLTGIYNRRGWDYLLEAEEERCKSYGHSAAVLVIDLNDLKKTNDQFGHDVGDQLIKHTADILAGSVREGDIVARLGGDEFGVICIQIDFSSTVLLLKQILQNLKCHQISAAIGFSMRHPSQDLHQACVDADKDMYQHKDHLHK
ncbi:sensor domain-containing diguanylate cyclase [Acinetobacter sp. ME22]|uniref:sensor domain-containing diguanylate cyclase n=1 Tax=Acinetobacter sp. ME22 TaxID=2904802 RepID=UPI001EDC0FC5|nr:sensor domain-containing diguanylate cyclase [Acinetobacter sp. ME22]MCG2572440.1 sensor domain-containing diguanylate cyclase [Acinetobacter sp. ME22]